MPDQTATLQRLVDEADIRDLVARFGDCATFNDAEGFRACWTDDAVWTIAKPADARCDGIEEIAALLAQLRDGKEFFVHFAVPGPIAIDGDVATVRCICHEAARGPGQYYRNHAIYFDRLRRTPDGWRFARRDYAYVWVDFSPFEGDVVNPRLDMVAPTQTGSPSSS